MTTAPVLITGSGGRLGRVLQRVGSGRLPIIGIASPRGIRSGRTLDITDADATLSTIAELRPRVIVHLASVVGAACEADPAVAEAVNVQGTGNLIEAARAHGVERFVLLSTAGVYGDSRRRPVSELDATMPAGIYASTKLRAEQLLKDSAGDVAVDVLRVFNVYGAEMSDSLITRVETSTPEHPARLAGLDRFVRDYVHADDVARAVFSAADSHDSGFRVLNVGTGIPRTNRDLLEAFPESARSSVLIGAEVDSYSCADITAIRRALSWEPSMPWPPGQRG